MLAARVSFYILEHLRSKTVARDFQLQPYFPPGHWKDILARPGSGLLGTQFSLPCAAKCLCDIAHR